MKAAPDSVRQTPVSDDTFRPDIQALRAIAVAAVVLFHLWPNGLTGGYVGVDVFFAISGFLITSHLLSEIDATGRLRAGRFWARRIKRLQPAALLVLATTMAGIVAFVPRNLWGQFFQEVVGSTLQLENWVLAYNAVDYLAANNAASPVQHFWTLSAEEQFYFGLPLLLLLSLGVSRLLGWGARSTIATVIAVVTAASFGYSVWLTPHTPSVAYLSTFTRAWEFAAGALLALLPLRAKPWQKMSVPWVGIAAIVVACVWYDDQTRFPGYAALLPVAGALLCLWGGATSILERLGRFAPVALVGRVSYAIYLWHWPLVILAPYVLARPANGVEKCLMLLASVALAWASTRFVEDPVRFSPRLLGGDRRPRTVAVWSVIAMSGVVGTALILIQIESRHASADGEVKRSVMKSQPRCLGAQSMDPRYAPCVNRALEGVLIPSLSDAKKDDANLLECWGSQNGVAKICQFGPATGFSKRLYAIGDSHSNTLIGVYRRIAEKHNWRIDLSGTAGCYLTTARQEQPSANAYKGCEIWRASVLGHAHAARYDGILVTHSTGDRLVVPVAGESRKSATVTGLVAAWKQLPQVPIVAIRDNPGMPGGVMECVARTGLESATACAPSRASALAFDGQEQAARFVPRARYVDLTDYYCDATTCPPVIGHVLVYRDGRHLTATYAETMLPYFERAIVKALETDGR